MTTAITTDLLTPLGAYLRLRERGRGSFLLESVEQGRLGRYSFVGAGSRLVYANEAEAVALPVVGYVGYEYAARLEPTVPVPDAGPRLPESRFLVAETLVRFDHANGVVDVLYGDGAELEEAQPPLRAGGARPRPTRRHPSQRAYEQCVRRAKQEIAAGEAFQLVLSQRAERQTDASPVELYRALRRINPSPYLFLLELD